MALEIWPEYSYFNAAPAVAAISKKRFMPMEKFDP